MEIFAGCSNRSTDSEHQSKKMGVVRSRFEKNAIRVCGDWSEQLSSKGKIYFYNCITEVSQWQKPSEWNLPDLQHDELIKVLSERDGLDGSAAKRPRLASNASASVRRDDADVNRVSPKRSKTYEHADSEKRYLAEDRFSVQRNVCSYTPKTRPPLRQRSFRESPKVDCNGSSHYTSQYSNSSNYGKRNLAVPMPRSAPADDMEISPNSSPLSGGSSPLAYSNSHSPRRSKCRTGTAPRVLKRGACSDANNHSRDITAKSGNSSHTLRQLLDAVRDSIGGLLDQSPCSNSSQKTRASGSANGLHFKQIPNSNDKVPLPSVNSTGHLNRSVDQVKGGSVHGGRLPPTELHDGNYLQSPGNVVARPNLSTVPSCSDRLNVKDKSMSGLVSTLSTLVNLIGTRNSNQSNAGDSSTHTPTQTSSYRQSFTRPHLLQQPQQHRFGHQPALSSPLTPSPATPSATGTSSGGGSSGSTLANSVSSAGTFSSLQQQDDSIYGPDRLGATKLRTSASASSHDLNSPRDIQRSVSPSRPSGLGVRDGHNILPNNSVPTDELSQERQKSMVETNTTMDQTQNELSTQISTGSASPVSSCSRVIAGLSRQYSPTTSLSNTYKSLPVVGLPNTTVYPRDPSTDKRCERPISPDKLYPSLDASETQMHIEPSLGLRFRDIASERLELEAQTEAKRFDRLHSVLYGELSAESKTLRALVRISEAKLALHKEKQSSLQDLMDTIECHRQLPNPSFPDDVI